MSHPLSRRRLLAYLGASLPLLAACGAPVASPTPAPKAAEPTKPAAAAPTTAPAAAPTMAPTTAPAPAPAATKPAEPTKPAAAATTAPAAAATTAPGAATGTAKIGVSFALSGPAAVYGAVQKNGVQLAEEELAKGGIPGMKLQLVIDDDAGTPEQGINVFKKLINQDKVAAIIGPTLSNVAQSADPEAQRAGVPVLGVSNTAPKGITDIGDFIFRNSLTEAQVIPQTVKAAKTKLNLKKVAILYSDNDAFTKAGYDVFKAAADAEGLQITTTQTFATKDTDFNAQLTAAKQTSPDALFVSALAAEASGLITQARALGITVPIVGGNGLNTPAIIKNAGKDAEGVIVGAAWNQASSNPKSVDFIKAYKAKFNADPDQFAAQAYTGVYIYAEALKIAKSGERADIRRALTTIKDFDTVLGKFSFTKDRDADHPAVIQIVKDGQFAVFA